MFFYRVGQFFKAITAKVTEDDIIFINNYLSDKEKELFFKLKVYDQKHCIDVAKDIKIYFQKNNIKNEDLSIVKNDLIKAGLLHDIGKIKKNLNPIQKSILVILDKFSKGKLKNLDNIKAIDIYYNHDKEGYKLLKENNYSKEFLNLVRNHHNYDVDNVEINILRASDDKN